MLNNDRKSTLRRALPYLLILIFGFIAFGVSLDNDFAFDDLIHIRDNVKLRFQDFGWSVISRAAFPGNLYRPLTFLSYAAEIKLFGEGALSFHLINILLHIFVAMLIYAVFSKRFGQDTALAAALIFVVHPVFTESVANISGRAEIFAALFCLLTIFLAQSERRYPWILISISSLLAASSKESGVLTPLMLLVTALSYEGDKKIVELPKKLVASCLGIMFYLGTRFYVLSGHLYSSFTVDKSDNPLAVLDAPRRIIEASALLVRYIRKIFQPLPLSADYSYQVISFFGEVSQLTYILALIVFILVGTSILKRKSEIGFSLLWFFSAFLLTSNILFPIGTIFAERLLYLPAIGLVLLIAYLLKHFLSRAMFIGFTNVIVIIASAASASYSVIWRDTETLADYQEHISPQSFRTQLLCAARDKNRKDYQGALTHIKKSLEILPDNDDAYYLEAQVKIDINDYPEAEKALQKALAINKSHAPSLNLYGRFLLNQNRLAQAGEIAEMLLAKESDNPDALLIKLAIALKENNQTSATELAERLKKMNYQNQDFTSLLKLMGK